MSITKDLRKVFDACTVMAGVEPDFECVYMTKGAALLYLDEIDAENAQLKERIVTQKQTIQAYRDESREWREEAEHAQAENAKLRELLQRLLVEYRYLRVRPRETYLQHEGRMRAIEEEMRDLGVEVDE